MKLLLTLSSIILLAALSSASYGKEEEEKKEKIHITVKGKPHPTDPNGTIVDFRGMDIGIPEKKERTITVRSDFATSVCVADIGPWQPYSEDIFRSSVDGLNWEKMSCKKRDAIANSLGAATVFIKGMSYVCQLTPLPQAQIAARVFDVTSYASASIGFFISVQSCKDGIDEKISALVKACENLREAGVNCVSVDNNDF